MTNDQGKRAGFTMVELLMVVVIISILIALLLPAINAAVRTARQTAVQSEINQLAAALESFKSKYGDYPPSRILLVENGNYVPYIGSNASLSSNGPVDSTSPGTGDITVGELAARSVAAIRKFWPRVQLIAAGQATASAGWYDFNGDNVQEQNGYVLHGHECLVFFLGGVPLPSSTPVTPETTFGMTGFGKDPTNPFTNSVIGSAAYNPSRDPPLFEFNPGRLFVDPSGTSGIPGYYDSLGSASPSPGSTTLNFYAYFSAYGSGAYDPNDVNFTDSGEFDGFGNLPVLQFQTALANFPLTTPGQPCLSPPPNPYSATLSVTPSGSVTFQKPQTFQIVSPGVDGLYGVGGQFVSPSATTTSASTSLPFDPNNTFAPAPPMTETEATIRSREKDNLTNFKSGTLQ
jgi:general secretion pathway protein G